MFDESLLSGISVLDFSRHLPVPLATQRLREWGADVVRIERNGRPDPMSMWPPFLKDGRSAMFAQLNDGKRTMTFDFKTDLDAILAQADDVDVVIEGFRPGVLTSMGLGPEAWHARNPKIIFVSVSGFGQTGEHAQLAGHDLTYLAKAGVLDGLRDASGRPLMPRVQIADIAGGTNGTIQAVLGGLLKRAKGASKQHVDVSITAETTWLATLLSAVKSVPGADITQLFSGGLVNYNVYECKDGVWIVLAPIEVKFWNLFCELVERFEWKRDDMMQLTVANFPHQEVIELFLNQPASHWHDLLDGTDACFCLASGG